MGRGRKVDVEQCAAVWLFGEGGAWKLVQELGLRGMASDRGWVG